MSQILKPPIVEVAGRRYRVLHGLPVSGQKEQSQDDVESVINEALDEEGQECWLEEVELLSDSEIEEERRQLITRISCDSDVFGFIIGRGGYNKKKIETETKARVIFPDPENRQEQGGEIVLKGKTRESITRARARIEAIIDDSLNSRALDYNYFISVPLASPASIDAFTAFKSAAVSDESAEDCNIEDSIFQLPHHLHLTVCMLKLYSDAHRLQTKRILDGMKGKFKEIVGKQPLVIKLAELEYMNDDPSSMNVLYMQVKEIDGEDRLQRLCNAVVDALAKEGVALLQDAKKVKMHVTVINTRYRRGGREEQQKESDRQSQLLQRIPFDGRKLLEEYTHVDLGEHTVKALHLSQRGKYDEENGYFYCAHKVQL